SFGIHRLDERSQPHISHFAPVTRFSRAADSLAGGSQGSIGNEQEQTLLVAGPNPSFHATWKKAHFASLERYSSRCGTLQADLNEAGPEHHAENMLILHLHMRRSGRCMHIYSYSHSLGHPPRRLDALIVSKNSARFGPRHTFRHEAIFRICFSD